MALDVTAGGANSNSYATVAEVGTYIDEHFVPETVKAKWQAATQAQKEASLIRATQLLDRHVRWVGEISTDTQALSWPRAFAFDRYDRSIESTVIPGFLKEFQIETALWVLDQSGVAPQIGNGEYDSIRVGVLEIDFNEKGAGRRSMLPEEVIAALSPMGQYKAAVSGGASTISLMRA
jgi:hypothetical protein